MIDEFNKLMDEQRYDEAASRGQAGRRTGPQQPGRGAGALAGEVRPPLPERQGHRRTQKEDGFVDALDEVDKAAIPFDDKNPLVFHDAKDWEELTQEPAEVLGRPASGNARSARSRSRRSSARRSRCSSPTPR